MGRSKRKSYNTRSKKAALRRSLETPEQRALRLEKCRIRVAARRACETEDERAIRLARERERARLQRAGLRQKAKSIERLMSQQNNGSEQINRNDRSYKAYLMLELQRAEDAKRAADRRRKETPEQRAARLEKCRIRAAVLRSCESEEKRAIRLARQRVRVRAARMRKAREQIKEREGMKRIRKSKRINPLVSTDRGTVIERTNTIQRMYAQHLAYQSLLQWHIRQRFHCMWKPAPDQMVQLSICPEPFAMEFKREGSVEGAIENAEADETDSCPSVGVECEITIDEEDEPGKKVFASQEPCIEGEPFETVMSDSTMEEDEPEKKVFADQELLAEREPFETVITYYSTLIKQEEDYDESKTIIAGEENCGQMNKFFTEIPLSETHLGQPRSEDLSIKESLEPFILPVTSSQQVNTLSPIESP